MIGEVIVDTSAALALHLFRVAEVAAVTVLVVAPEQYYILRHFQSVMIGIKHLFISAEHLRNLLNGLLDVAAQHIPLVVDGLLHQCHAFGC